MTANTEHDQLQRLKETFQQWNLGEIVRYVRENANSLYYDAAEPSRAGTHRMLSATELGVDPLLPIAAGVTTFLYGMLRDEWRRDGLDSHLLQDILFQNLNFGSSTRVWDLYMTILPMLEDSGLLFLEQDQRPAKHEKGGPDVLSKAEIDKLLSSLGGPMVKAAESDSTEDKRDRVLPQGGETLLG